MTSRASLAKGGESGTPAIVAGEPDRSPLFLFPAERVEDMEMPPLRERKKYPALTAEELGTLRAWIAQGAQEGKG